MFYYRRIGASFAAALLIVVVLSPQAVSAAPTGTVMVATQRMSGPSLPPGSTQVGTYSKGKVLTLTCYKRGQSVKGYYSPYISGGWDNLWYKVSDGYFVADVDINTGSNKPVTAECGVVASPSATNGRNGYSYPLLPHSSLSTYSNHNGDDFSASLNQAVYSMAAGTVKVQSVQVGNWCPASVAINGAQKEIILTSVIGGKTYVFRYAHFNSFAVKDGAKVTSGQLIGYAGKSGCASGVHVHIDVTKNGALVYPRDLLGLTKY